MQLNQRLIEQLCSGEIAAENNGTLGQLMEVLIKAFPEDKSNPLEGEERFYFKLEVKHYSFGWEWDCHHKTRLPIVSIKDFYKDE